MRVSVFGLGYVGAVSAGCLANDGHHVIGVDINPSKVDQLNEGHSTIVGDDLETVVQKAVSEGRLKAATDVKVAIDDSEISLICVGTPSQPNGDLDLSYVVRVCEEIGSALRDKPEFHTVVMRSTVLPGTTNRVVIPTLERTAGKRAADDFGVCVNPEFLREGSEMHDYYHPSKTVIAGIDEASGEKVASLYRTVDSPITFTDIETAEMVKYADNAWHATKIGFANEIGNISKALGIDSHRVMGILCQDTKLNLSPSYLRPGFAFGGSCLPKDLRALTYKARSLDLNIPILNAILPSNANQIDIGVQMVMARGAKKIGVLGFSFKAGTDDLRESPVLILTEQLLGKGYDIRLYDPNVNLDKLVGSNREYILNQIPHISRLMVNKLEEVLSHADTVVVGNADSAFDDISSRLREEQHLVDFVRISDIGDSHDTYEGICW